MLDFDVNVNQKLNRLFLNIYYFSANDIAQLQLGLINYELNTCQSCLVYSHASPKSYNHFTELCNGLSSLLETFVE
jgi:hypothetical protein